MAITISICAVFMIVLDNAYFGFAMAMKLLSIPPALYFVKYVCLPNVIGVGLISIMWYVEKGFFSPDRKTAVLAFVITTMCGLASIFHGFYPQLWLVPSFGLMFLVISHNQMLKRGILTYIYVIMTLTFIMQIKDRSQGGFVVKQSVFLYYVQHYILNALIIAMFYAFTKVLHTYLDEMMEDNLSLLKQSDEFQDRVARDVLTGCYSRDYLSHNIEKIFRRCSNRQPTTVALIDIDNFKHVNDTYGHDCGDKVLERIGRLSRTMGHSSAERPDYRVCRYGGEEFLFIFRDLNPVVCQKQMEEFRRAFENQHYDFTDDRITISGGIVTCSSQQEFNTVFKAVDDALYQAKASGKNRIVAGKGI